jgi:hypothetical protein
MTRVSSAAREQVRQRANHRCEYCRKPDSFSPHDYHVDHIISQKHHGSDELHNLAWACFRCNASKGTDIAAYDPQTGVLTPLFNPRTQSWEEHFELDGNRIIGKTPVGRVTVFLLDFNHPDQVETRRLLIAAGLW